MHQVGLMSLENDNPWVEVADEAQLEDNKIKLVRVKDVKIGIVKRHGRIFAFSAMCTHARIFLAPGRLGADGLIECPMHGAKFSPEDGAVRCAPATEPLLVYDAKILSGKIVVNCEGRLQAQSKEAVASAWAKWTTQ